MGTLAELSALYRPPWGERARERDALHVLRDWHVDDAGGGAGGGSHACFDAAAGTFTAPRDALYALVVQVIPTDGGANVAGALRRRQHVRYVVRVDEPPRDGDGDGDSNGGSDGGGTQFLDVGPVSFGEVLHLRAGATVAVAALPGPARRDSVRLRIAVVQRKRKREPEPQLSKKELKKLNKLKKRRKRAAERAASAGGAGVPECAPEVQRPGVEIGETRNPPEGEAVVAAVERKVRKREEEDSDSSTWSAEFSSDASGDDLPHSKRGVSRLAKRLKSASAGSSAPAHS